MANTVTLHDGTVGELGECKSCKAAIVWAKTATGSNMPYDVDALELLATGQAVAVPDVKWNAAHPDKPRTLSHWATCRSAQQHRR